MSEKDQSKIEEIGMKEMNEASGGVESSILGGILDLFGKLFGGKFLVQPGNDEQHRAAHHDDDAEMRMHEIDHHHKQRHGVPQLPGLL